LRVKSFETTEPNWLKEAAEVSAEAGDRCQFNVHDSSQVLSGTPVFALLVPFLPLHGQRQPVCLRASFFRMRLVERGKPVSSDAIVEDLRISALALAETAALICHNAGSAAAQTVFTLNLDHVVKMRKDAMFRGAYGRAGLITADGFPIVLACSLQGKRVNRVAGSDLIAPISAEAARSGKSIYLFGSSSKVLIKASRLLQERNAGLTIAGVFAPPQGFDPTSEDARRCIAAIGNSAADLCFVALGAPKQELFADYAKSLLPNISFVCIGAGLDFIAGAQVRAPHWMQRWDLEWLWRAASDPRRLLYRYLLCMAALPGILARAALVSRWR
jgi:N-acetylglucosaminyldiphosphoundecaprenol N-acetyl-beta-D-mannosaminyltransferase